MDTMAGRSSRIIRLATIFVVALALICLQLPSQENSKTESVDDPTAYDTSSVVTSESRSAANQLELRRDSSKVSLRRFDQTTLNETKRKYQFDEGNIDSKAVAESWISRVWRWFIEQFDNTIGFGNTAESIFWICVIVGALVFVYNFGGGRTLFQLRKKSSAILFPHATISDIENLDIDMMIQRAVEQNDYREAVRLCYIDILKNLAGEKLIRWRADYTNHTYVQQLQSTPFAVQFEEISSLFDYLVYGEFHADETVFQYAQGVRKEFLIKVRENSSIR